MRERQKLEASRPDFPFLDLIWFCGHIAAVCLFDCRESGKTGTEGMRFEVIAYYKVV